MRTGGGCVGAGFALVGGGSDGGGSEAAWRARIDVDRSSGAPVSTMPVKVAGGVLPMTVLVNGVPVGEIDGRRRTVCCARCAISEAYQEKKPLRLIAATDYVSGKDIDPKQAYFVEGSHRVLCAHNEAMVDESKHVQPMTYDRCFPGTYAFAHREDAEAFERENGGTVLRLDKLLQGVSGQ